MLRRCYDRKSSEFVYYGGRGITVCARWRDSFEAFLADMGSRPSPAHSIDREDNDGNYEPGNCRWATDDVQNANRSNVRRILVDGQALTIREVTARLGLPDSTIRGRKEAGWTDAEILGHEFHKKRPGLRGRRSSR